MSGLDPQQSARAELIADIQQIHKQLGTISRYLYRVNGKFSERQWRKFFHNFREFLHIAGLAEKTPSVPDTPLELPPPPVTKPEPSETNEFVGDKWNITVPRSKVSTLEELLKERNVDPAEWTVERFKVKQWEMGSKDANDNPVVTPLWAVSATLVKNKVVTFVKDEIASLKERFKADRVCRHVIRKSPIVSHTKSGNMLELNIPDLHAGKLAWSKETGYKDYDTNIALDLYDEAIDHILADTAHIKFDQILFITGNDMMHSDTIGGTTTSGTQLDNDSRYHKVFVKLRNRIIDVIKYKLLPVAPVKVLSCPGNHDKLTAWHLADSIELYFHGNPNVEVDNSPKEFKFHQHGEVMLMFCHGNTGKKPDYPLTMASREKQMWGDTTYREAHTGHVHQTMVQEFHGVRVRTLPALCEPDAWHAANNFVGNLRAAEAFVWNNEKGLIAQAYYNAD